MGWQKGSLLKSISETIADYRDGEIAPPTPAHVELWVEQFDREVQEPLLSELSHVLKETYFPKATVEDFLSVVATSEKLAGTDQYAFWKNMRFLSIQESGNSQREMLRMFGRTLRSQYGLNIEDCGAEPQAFLYLDDGVFTGNRVRGDLSKWVSTHAPETAVLYVVTIGQHSGGQHYADLGIKNAAKDAGKNVTVHWWRCVELEDRMKFIDLADVLRPACIPDDGPTREYAESLTRPLVFRTPGQPGRNNFFSSEEHRHLLEQEFLKAGVRIRSQCSYLNNYQRPLGNSVLEGLGFGSLMVTFRNCPNNCPLVFWVGDPWYPLFPRRPNK